MAVINGTADWGFVPLDYSSSNLSEAFYGSTANNLKSANDPLRYQVQWFSGGINESQEPSASNWDSATSSGDVVNVIFDIIDYSDLNNLKTIATIKKSRDIANKRFDTQAPASGHRFTINISQIISDQLSYSLCPINKGTWQSTMYGGMNGGLVMQDNVIGNSAGTGNPISNYNVSKNGTYINIRVKATFEVIYIDGSIIDSTTNITSEKVSYINSVNQFEKNSLYYPSTYRMDISASAKNSFLSRCPNFTENDSPLNYSFQKPIREDEQAEYLQFFIRRAYSDDIRNDGSDDRVGNIGLYVETFLVDGTPENQFYMRDFEDNLTRTTSGTGYEEIDDYQEAMFVQNISPYYMNNTSNLIGLSKSGTVIGTFPFWDAYTGNKITSSTAYYRVSMSRFSLFTSPSGGYPERRTSNYNYYTIDRESAKIPYEFVRFHWLNSVGGIDSYTAKRDIVEGLTISRDVIERKSSDRTWYQVNSNDSGVELDPSLYHSDTMRGGDIYKGGREVTNVNAERTQSVYTEPLNKDVAKWLEEMMLSPNVWIEMETDATKMGNTRNPYLRPSDKEYIPVVITNSDVESVNQENGLVKFNIEYTLAHKVITQRN